MPFNYPIGSKPDDATFDLRYLIEVLPEGITERYPDANHRGPALVKKYPGYDWESSSFLSKAVNQVISVKAGTYGEIEMRLFVEYDFWEYESKEVFWSKKFGTQNMLVHRTGTISATCGWDFICKQSGDLTLRGYHRVDSRVSDNLKITVRDRDTAMPDARPPFLPFKASLDYAGFDTGIAKIPDFVPVVGGDGLPFSGYSASAYSSPTPHPIAFINITDKPEPPKPAPTATPEALMPLMTVIPFAKEGQRELDREARSIAKEWVDGMFLKYPKLELPMAHGDVPVYCFGYASKTAPAGENDRVKIEDYNRELGKDRALNVGKYLIPELLGSKVDFTYKSYGSEFAQWGTVYDKKFRQAFKEVNKPRDVDRIVLVWVDYEKASQIINQKK